MGKLLLLKEAATPMSWAFVSLYPSLSLSGLALAQLRQSFLLRWTLCGGVAVSPSTVLGRFCEEDIFLGDFEVEEVVMWEQSSEGGKGWRLESLEWVSDYGSFGGRVSRGERVDHTKALPWGCVKWTQRNRSKWAGVGFIKILRVVDR